MKKVYTIISFVFLFISAWCQTSKLTAFSVPYNKKTVKVKEYKPNIYLTTTYIDDANNYISILSLCRMDGFYGFPYVVFNLYTGDIRIKDFGFIGDTVFICGEHIDKVGFIGFFNIDTLFNASWNTNTGWQHSPKTINIHKGFDTEYSGNVKTLDKIVTYYNPETIERHASCIGEAETRDNRLVRRDCIVDFYENYNTWFYHTGIPDHTNTNSFEDITYVESSFHDFVVTAGFETDSCLTVRLFNSSGLFTLPAMNTIHIFNGFSATMKPFWETDNIEITPIGDGNVLTASRWRYPLEPTPRVNQIHISRLSTYLIYNNVAGSMIWSRELAPPDCPDIISIDGLLVNYPKNSIALLFEADQSPIGGSSNRSFFLEVDKTIENVYNGIKADGYGNALDLNLRSIDVCNNGNNYIMAGFCLPSVYQKITHLFETSHIPSLCEPPITSYIKKLEPVMHNSQPSQILTFAGRSNFISLQTIFEVTGLDHPCPENDIVEDGQNEN
ncbi:MAG: hypothetical protein K6A67_06250 [Bacteroidales bacterium]|nr:hypothetical protein [Bacteroidales bacterium]